MGPPVTSRRSATRRVRENCLEVAASGRLAFSLVFLQVCEWEGESEDLKTWTSAIAFAAPRAISIDDGTVPTKANVVAVQRRPVMAQQVQQPSHSYSFDALQDSSPHRLAVHCLETGWMYFLAQYCFLATSRRVLGR